MTDDITPNSAAPAEAEVAPADADADDISPGLCMLAEPIEHKVFGTVTELRFRAPVSGDFRGLLLTDMAVGAFTFYLDLIPRVSVRKFEPEFWNTLSPANTMAVVRTVSAFFSNVKE